MSLIGRFAEYAAAFEKAFETDDWSPLESFFTDDAVYMVGLASLRAEPVEGRDAILAYFKAVLDRLDRRFESRELTLLDGPGEDGATVWIRGAATYTAPDLPSFVLELEERVTFDQPSDEPGGRGRAGARIRRLEDRYTPEMADAFARYVADHGERLDLRIPV